MSEFNLDNFIAGLNTAKEQSSKRNPQDRLNRVVMNSRTNQGTLTFIPIYSEAAANFYQKISNVYEFFGDTSVVNAEDGIWFRILPLEYYGNLTDEQIALHQEVIGLLDLLKDKEGDNLSYEEFRIRQYSLFYGILLKLKNTEQKEIEDLVDCPCLFVYPSANPVNQLCDAINTKIDNMGGNKEWIRRVFTPNAGGRRGVVQVKFIKASGPGYDCNVNFLMNNSDEGIITIDPDYEVDPKIQEKFKDVLPEFLGWEYDRENSSAFNPVVFKELRDQLKVRLKGDAAPAEPAAAPENKNDLAPAGGRRPF